MVSTAILYDFPNERRILSVEREASAVATSFAALNSDHAVGCRSPYMT